MERKKGGARGGREERNKKVRYGMEEGGRREEGGGRREEGGRREGGRREGGRREEGKDIPSVN
jgi:ATP-dependent RNA helicase DeaD